MSVLTWFLSTSNTQILIFRSSTPDSTGELTALPQTPSWCGAWLANPPFQEPDHRSQPFGPRFSDLGSAHGRVGNPSYNTGTIRCQQELIITDLLTVSQRSSHFVVGLWLTWTFSNWTRRSGLTDGQPMERLNANHKPYGDLPWDDAVQMQFCTRIGWSQPSVKLF